ncbi:Plasmid stabilization system protein ParE (fragment) [Imperialibacter sp. EC-SDR9]
MPRPKIIWSTQSKESLKEIYDYYKVKSLRGAKNVRSDLMNAPRKIIFAKQYR